MRRFTVPIPLLLLFSLLALPAWTWPGKVIKVADGDTLTVLRDGREQVRIRLYGIDAPESKQDFGTRSKQSLSDMAYGQTVEVTPVVQDHYGRTVAHIQVRGQDVSEAQVKDGMAWVYRQYCTEAACKDWLRLEQQARDRKAGLWAGPSPMPPWEWRHGGAQSVSQVEKSKAKPDTQPGIVYHGNVRSGVFHRPGCQHYNCKNCVDVFPSREAAIKAGYRPCPLCRP